MAPGLFFVTTADQLAWAPAGGIALRMHEVSLMHSILATVAAAAGQNGIRQVTAVKLVVGAERMVLPAALRFAFDLLKREPLAADAVLHLEERAGQDFFIEYFEGE